jgi:23S rRNA pseudouridine2605 synthase
MSTMRINRYIAHGTGMSRRAADQAILDNRVRLNNATPQPGANVSDTDVVTLDGTVVTLPETFQTIILNKPTGYVVSRDGQGSKTVYDLLPPELHTLKPVGRLDKDSSGLLLLTDNGELAQALTHPSYQKKKVYIVHLNKPLTSQAVAAITKGVPLEDGSSHLELKGNDMSWVVSMYEGRNRQIRRTFAYLDYNVVSLHRIRFGDYALSSKQRPGDYIEVY